MYRNDKVIRHYSGPFKLQILSELSTGKYTKSELCKLYSIAPTIVNEWIKKYNRKDLMNTRVKVETKDEITRIKALKKDLDAMVYESYLEVAAKKITKNAINLYNKIRLHVSLDYKTPNMVYKLSA